MDINALDPKALVGIMPLIAIVPFLVGHLKGLARAMHDYRRGWDSGDDSVWPFVTDVVTVIGTIALWSSGMIPEAAGWAWPAIVLLGLALSIVIQKGYDVVVTRRASAVSAPASPGVSPTYAPAADLRPTAPPAPAQSQDPSV